VPLFPSYFFCRFEFQRRLPILMSPGLVQIVGSQAAPEPVAEDELAAVRAIVNSHLRAEPWPFLELGKRVLIVFGPLAGIEGDLIEFKGGHRLVVSVTLLQRSIAAEVEGSWVYPLPETASQPRHLPTTLHSASR
jgi:transcription antitermination factor NusG